jgi:uncharacterized protein
MRKLSHRQRRTLKFMSTHRLDPARLDVAALVAEGATVSGHWPALKLGRWHALQTPSPGVEPAEVHWVVRGEQRHASGHAAQTWMHLQVQAVAWLTCQRCLQPFSEPLNIERAIRFVPTEPEAESLDADSEDDVLAMSPAPDLRLLVEDELLLALPIVPRHRSCGMPAGSGQEPADAAAASPFAALAALKSRPPEP